MVRTRCVAVQIVVYKGHRGARRVAQEGILIPTRRGQGDNAGDLHRFGRRRSGAQMEISDRYVFGEPDEGFLEYAGAAGKIARSVDHQVSQIRSLLDGGGTEAVAGVFELPNGKMANEPNPFRTCLEALGNGPGL